MITPNKKTKQKNIFTALAIIGFMIFLFFFTLYNVGVFDRQLWLKKKQESEAEIANQSENQLKTVEEKKTDNKKSCSCC